MGNEQSRTTNYKIYKITGKYIRGNGSYMRFYLDDYVPYKNGNRKFIDFKCTFFSRPVVAHYFEGEYVKIDIERTRYENSGYEFDFLSDVIKAVKEGSSGSTSETAANLGEIGEAIEARQNFIASIEQSRHATNHAWTKQTSWDMPPGWK